MCIIIFSCSKQELIGENPTDNETTSLNKATNNRVALEKDILILENKMQWVSYLTAQVLLKDEPARKEFVNLLSNRSPKVIKLQDILRFDSENNSFREAFEVEFNYYQTEGNDCGRPEGRPKPNTQGLRSEVTYSAFNSYISSLLEDECLELYMPNGFNSNFEAISSIPPTSITTSAHPLVIPSKFNRGFIHKGRCQIEKSIVSSVTMGTVIIVRPYRLINGCSYKKYSGINFQDF